VQQGQGLRLWVLGSAALMVIGAFGPWVKVLGQSVGGTDGSNDGWLVVAAAVVGGLLFYVARGHRSGGLWALLAGIAGIAVTLHDRSKVENAINEGGEFARALAQVGWGLNLALAASVSMAIAGLVYLFQQTRAQPPLARPAPPPSTPSPGPTEEPTSASQQDAPTPPPD
jgi:hypothetical protein